jgi:hypothetical protein
MSFPPRLITQVKNLYIATIMKSVNASTLHNKRR